MDATYPITPARRPRNKAEALFYDFATARGWTLTRRGWPDFFCWKDGRFVLVEVKPHRGRKLKRDQLAVMSALSRLGVPCYRWNPGDNQFQQICPTADPLAPVM